MARLIDSLSPEELQVLEDMYGKDSPSLSEELRRAREASLKQSFGKQIAEEALDPFRVPGASEALKSSLPVEVESREIVPYKKKPMFGTTNIIPYGEPIEMPRGSIPDRKSLAPYTLPSREVSMKALPAPSAEQILDYSDSQGPSKNLKLDSGTFDIIEEAKDSGKISPHDNPSKLRLALEKLGIKGEQNIKAATEFLKGPVGSEVARGADEALDIFSTGAKTAAKGVAKGVAKGASTFLGKAGGISGFLAPSELSQPESSLVKEDTSALGKYALPLASLGILGGDKEYDERAQALANLKAGLAPKPSFNYGEQFGPQEISEDSLEEQSNLPLPTAAGKVSAARVPAEMSAKKELPQSSQVAPQTPTKPISSPELDVYGEDLGDAALKAAQEQQRTSRLFAGLGRAAELGSATIAGRKASLEPYEALEKQSEQGVKNILARREAKDKELSRKKTLLDFADDKKLRDPDSSESMAAREKLKGLGYPMADDVSYHQLKQMGIDMGKLLGHELDAKAKEKYFAALNESKKEAREGTQDRFQRTEVYKYQQAAEAAAKPAYEATRAVGELESLANMAENNPIAYNAIGTKMAKVMGEVGNLSSSDVTRYTGRKDIAGKVAKASQELIKGTATPEDLKYIKEVVTSLKGKADEYIQNKYEHFSKLHSKNTGMPLEESRGFFNIESKQSSPNELDSKIDRFMKANNIKSREEAIEILKANNRL